MSGLFARWLGRPDLLAARLELTVAATRDPALADRFRTWRDDLVSMVREVMQAAGKADGRQGGASAETLVAALDGVLLASLVLPARRRRAFVSESVEQLLAGLAPDPRES